MTDLLEELAVLEHELASRQVPSSVERLADRLGPLSVGLRQQIPIAFRDTRMFRIRRMNHQPEAIKEVGIPPSESATIGRLNDTGQSVLYLADSPDTAFAEARATAGDFCLSEWRVTAEKLALANGGLPPALLSERLPSDNRPIPVLSEIDQKVFGFFRKAYTLPVEADRSLYRWSIACGLANGFAHHCDRSATKELQGDTGWTGHYPFAAIAYPSVRTNHVSINYAVNDRGRPHVQLNHVQWVRRSADGSFTGLDFADDWASAGTIHWRNRPASFQLKSGERASLTKISENTWTYETAEGTVPWFA